jgi:DNA topoisomerase I
VSAAIIPKRVDKAMDKASAKRTSAPAGISIRNGPITGDKMDVDKAVSNGKRKSRGSAANAKSYKEVGSDDEDEDVKPNVGSLSADPLSTSVTDVNIHDS